MKHSFFILPLFFILISCNSDEDHFTPIPENILPGDAEYIVYDSIFELNASQLEDGLSGSWEVIQNTASYTLSDPLNPNCIITGEYRGQYQIRWTVTNGKEEKHKDITIKMFKRIPDNIIQGESSFELYTDSLSLNGINLTEGLTGTWELVEGSNSYTLSNPEDPKCIFKGELLGSYKLRWTIFNGKDEKYDDIDINIVGFTDKRDYQKYKAIKIGNQIWMAENLRTKYFTNGDLINDGTGIGDISDLSNPKYWFSYDEDISFIPTYGRLYTWFTLSDNRNICPCNWHIPDNTEWKELADYLGGEFIAGGELKEQGTEHWFSPNEGATNGSGFTALPGGMRGYGGSYGNLGYSGNWWSLDETTPSEAYSWALSFNNTNFYYGGSSKKVGFSVRCIKD